MTLFHGFSAIRHVPKPLITDCPNCMSNSFNCNEYILEDGFDDNVWKKQIVNSLSKMLQNGDYSDVKIRSATETLDAHKMILSIGSPYFKSLFGSGWMTTKSNAIDLSHCDSECFRLVVNYIYSGNIKLTLDNVTEILTQADYFQINQLKCLCCRFLTENLNGESCLPVYELTKSLRCYDVTKFSFRYAMKNLSRILRHCSFLNVQPETLVNVLEAPVVGIEAEDELFDAIVEWLNVDESREIWRYAMLRLIGIDSLTEENQLNYHAQMIKSKEYKAEDIYSASKVPCRFKNEVELIVVFGGESSGSIKKNGETMAVCNLIHSKWSCSVMAELPNTEDDDDFIDSYYDLRKQSSILSAPQLARSYGTIVNLNNILYLIGGVNNITVETYHLAENKYEMLPSLPNDFHGSGSAVLDDQIWVVGGKSLRTDGTNCCSFDDHLQEWVNRPGLQNGRSHLAAASVGGFIYAVGGILVKKSTKMSMSATRLCEKYDPQFKKWTPMAKLHEKRAYHCLEVVDDYLYAIGGFDSDRTWLSSMEKYDPFADQWFVCPEMMNARSSFGSTVCDGNIYCMGGFNGSMILNCVERFNPRQNKWHCLDTGPMMQRRMGLVAGTFRVPRDRFESETMARRRRLKESGRKDRSLEAMRGADIASTSFQ